MKVDSIALKSKGVILEPIGMQHIEALKSVVQDGELWRISTTQIPKPDQVGDYIKRAIQQQAIGSDLVFAIRNQVNDQVVGCTRYRNIDSDHRKVNIGPTFIAKAWHRSHVNTECKYLLLKHGFEVWNLNRVEMHCDVLNIKSRNAIKRLGAKEEGIIRHHMIMPNGRIRDTVIHSIVNPDWPEVKCNLETKIIQYSYALSA